MFNLFRNKHKRSDWLEGLLESEGLIQSGWSSTEVVYYACEIYSTIDGKEVKQGLLDHLRYHREVLSKI